MSAVVERAADPADRVRDTLLRAAAVAGGHVRWFAAAVPALDAARAAGIEAVELVDPADAGWPGAVDPGEPAGVVVLESALEQLPDPETALRRLGDSPVLADGGRLVLGVRNAASAGVVAELLAGRAPGTGSGLLDRRQRSWFTLGTLRTLLEATGFVVVEVHRVTGPPPPAGLGALPEPRTFGGEAGAGAAADVDSWLTESYVVSARRNGAAARLAELAEQLTAARATEATLRARAGLHAVRVEALQALLGEERAEHARLVEDGRRDLVALRTENAELNKRLAADGARLAQLEAAAATVRASAAYQLGERVLSGTGPLRAARRRARRAVASTRKRLR